MFFCLFGVYWVMHFQNKLMKSTEIGGSGKLVSPSGRYGIRYQLALFGAYGQKEIADALMEYKLP